MLAPPPVFCLSTLCVGKYLCPPVKSCIAAAGRCRDLEWVLSWLLYSLDSTFAHTWLAVRVPFCFGTSENTFCSQICTPVVGRQEPPSPHVAAADELWENPPAAYNCHSIKHRLRKATESSRWVYPIVPNDPLWHLQDAYCVTKFCSTSRLYFYFTDAPRGDSRISWRPVLFECSVSVRPVCDHQQGQNAIRTYLW